MKFTLFILSLSVSVLYASDDADKTSKSYCKVKSDTYDASIPSGYILFEGSFTDPGLSESIPFSTVISKPSNTGVLADIDGKFSLKVPLTDSCIFFYHNAYSEVPVRNTFKNQHKVIVEVFLVEEVRYELLKPVVYAYDSPAKFTLSILPKGSITFTYPFSKEATWNIFTNSDGTLTNTQDGRIYPYLFWEGSDQNLQLLQENKSAEGFLIKTDTCVSFLENVLGQYGLNQKEQTDFITFWVPKMIATPYAFVQFLTNDSYASNIAELKISEWPETIIRLYMYLVPLDKCDVTVNIFRPTIVSPLRKGFTVVEWGGSVIKDSTFFNEEL